MMIRRFVLLVVIAMAAVSLAQNPKTAPVAGFRIAGAVVDRLSGQPLAETTVVLAPINERRDEISFRTGADGRFLFSNLPPGKYSLGAKRRGYTLQGFEQHEFFSTAIAVGPNIDTEHLIFRLRPDSAIRGTITDENNEPAANMHVQLFGTRMENGENSIHRISQTITDDRGQYVFPHLQEGTYYVAASGRPWYSDNFGFLQQARTQNTNPEVRDRIEQEAAKLDLVYPLTFYSGALSSDNATPIQLAVGDAVTVDMTLQPVHSVHIRVPAGPAPVVPEGGDQGIVVGGSERHPSFRNAPPRISLFRDAFGTQIQENAMISMFSNPDGSYEIAGIAPGRYTVQVDSQGNSKISSSHQEVDLGGDLDLSTASGTALASVSGTMWLDGAPLDKAVVEMRAPDGRRGYAVEVKKGIFRFNEAMPPGQYQVTIASQTNNSFYLSSLSATGAKVTGRTVQITAGAAVQLAIVASQGIAQIDGVAKLSDKPKAGAMILLVPEDMTNNSALVRRDQSDSDGTFTLRNVVPGRYHLLAIENGWKLAWADPKVLNPYLANAQQWVIQPNQKLQVTVEVQSAK